jgi:poly(3-hydroxybutyrate) depolymerase
MAVVLLVVGLAGTAWAGSLLKSYVSPVDGSTQSYGLYVPTRYANFATHPVIFTGHGFSRTATPSASFSNTQTRFAENNGYLLVNLYGRGNTFYDGLGEDDFFQVLAALKRDYRIDESRIFFEGPSMGATGAYRLGIRYPDILAAVGLVWLLRTLPSVVAAPFGAVLGDH